MVTILPWDPLQRKCFCWLNYYGEKAGSRSWKSALFSLSCHPFSSGFRWVQLSSSVCLLRLMWATCLCCVNEASVPLRGLPGHAWLRAPSHCIRLQGTRSSLPWVVILGTHSRHIGKGYLWATMNVNWRIVPRLICQQRETTAAGHGHALLGRLELGGGWLRTSRQLLWNSYLKEDGRAVTFWETSLAGRAGITVFSPRVECSPASEQNSSANQEPCSPASTLRYRPKEEVSRGCLVFRKRWYLLITSARVIHFTESQGAWKEWGEGGGGPWCKRPPL